MTTWCGDGHTISLSNDGTLHSCGYNCSGQLGLGNKKNVSLLTRITKLPKINQVSCGAYFTVCIDYEGFLWAFGDNGFGQLGTESLTNFNVPQKIQDIPRVHSVACGKSHTLIITTDSNLWGCGCNEFGQLFLENKKNQTKFRETSFSNISKISAGGNHSLFQNSQGEIYGCGQNDYGQIGLGQFSRSQIKVSPIPNVPENIIQFCCGFSQSYFLDFEGNVFSVGYNNKGNLGLGHNTNQNILNKIPDIPPMQSIASMRYSCYLLDFDGNVWSFGDNCFGELGHGDKEHRNVPKKIESLKNIQQLSYGNCAWHFLATDFQNKIFVTGANGKGQLGTGNTQSNYSTPTGINSQEEIKTLAMIQSKIKKVKLCLECNNNNKIKQEFPQNSFESWNEVNEFLNEKLNQINSKLDEKQDTKLQNQKDVHVLENELKDIENKLKQLQLRKVEIGNMLPKVKQSQRSFEENFKEMEENQRTLKEMCHNVSIFCKNENEMNEELIKLYSNKKFKEFDCSDISKLLWKMDLTKYQSAFETSEVNGEFVEMMIDDFVVWNQLGVEKRDCYFMMFYFEMMKTPGYLKTLLSGYEPDCCVCNHASPKKTIHLLQEYDIPFERDEILKNNFCTPLFTFPVFNDILVLDAFSPNGRKIMTEITKWKKGHKLHLKALLTKGTKRELEEGLAESPRKKQKLTHSE